MKIISLLIALLQPTESGPGAVFGYKGDKWNKGGMACQTRVIKAKGLQFWKTAMASGIAHRTAACGSKKIICTTDKRGKNHCITTHIVDRGPYMAIPPGHSDKDGVVYTGPILPQGWRRRGVVDLLPGAASKLGFVGTQHRPSLRVFEPIDPRAYQDALRADISTLMVALGIPKTPQLQQLASRD